MFTVDVNNNATTTTTTRRSKLCEILSYLIRLGTFAHHRVIESGGGGRGGAAKLVGLSIMHAVCRMSSILQPLVLYRIIGFFVGHKKY